MFSRLARKPKSLPLAHIPNLIGPLPTVWQAAVTNSVHRMPSLPHGPLERQAQPASGGSPSISPAGCTTPVAGISDAPSIPLEAVVPLQCQASSPGLALSRGIGRLEILAKAVTVR